MTAEGDAQDATASDSTEAGGGDGSSMGRPIKFGKERKYDLPEGQEQVDGIAGRKKFTIEGDDAVGSKDKEPEKLKDLEAEAELNAILKRSPSTYLQLFATLSQSFISFLRAWHMLDLPMSMYPLKSHPQPKANLKPPTSHHLLQVLLPLLPPRKDPSSGHVQHCTLSLRRRT